jgi:hypothetical protein
MRLGRRLEQVLSLDLAHLPASQGSNYCPATSLLEPPPR